MRYLFTDSRTGGKFFQVAGSHYLVQWTDGVEDVFFTFTAARNYVEMVPEGHTREPFMHPKARRTTDAGASVD